MITENSSSSDVAQFSGAHSRNLPSYQNTPRHGPCEDAGHLAELVELHHRSNFHEPWTRFVSWISGKVHIIRAKSPSASCR